MSDLAFELHAPENPEGFIASMGAHISFHGDDMEDNEENNEDQS